MIRLEKNILNHILRIESQQQSGVLHFVLAAMCGLEPDIIGDPCNSFSAKIVFYLWTAKNRTDCESADEYLKRLRLGFPIKLCRQHCRVKVFGANK